MEYPTDSMPSESVAVPFRVTCAPVQAPTRGAVTASSGGAASDRNDSASDSTWSPSTVVMRTFTPSFVPSEAAVTTTILPSKDALRNGVSGSIVADAIGLPLKYPSSASPGARSTTPSAPMRESTNEIPSSSAPGAAS